MSYKGLQLSRRLSQPHLHDAARGRRQADPVRLHRWLCTERRSGGADGVLLECTSEQGCGVAQARAEGQGSNRRREHERCRDEEELTKYETKGIVLLYQVSRNKRRTSILILQMFTELRMHCEFRGSAYGLLHSGTATPKYDSQSPSIYLLEPGKSHIEGESISGHIKESADRRRKPHGESQAV